MKSNVPIASIVSLVAIAFALVACGGGGGPEGGGKVVVTGSSTVAPVVAEIGKRFEAERPGVRVDVQTGGSSRGIADARNGLADIGMASRALDSSESDLQAFPIARDGVCLFVHTENPVAELTDDEIRAIYRGEIERWSEVGGAEAEITVVSKAEGRATLAVFLEYFGLESPEIAADVIVGDNEQAVKTVLGDPNAIAYVSIGTAEYHAAQGEALRLLPTGGVAATSAHLADGSFPVSRPLNLVTRDVPEGLVRDFIDYARSPAVHDLVRNLHFVPIE